MKEALSKRQRGVPEISGSSFATLCASFHGTGIYLICIPDPNVQGEDFQETLTNIHPDLGEHRRGVSSVGAKALCL